VKNFKYHYSLAWHKISGEVEANNYSEAVAKVTAIKDSHFKTFGIKSNKLVVVSEIIK